MVIRGLTSQCEPIGQRERIPSTKKIGEELEELEV